MNKIPIIQQIEESLKHKMLTPRDFTFLREQIFNRLHVYVSSTTLKRIWGYLDDGGQPRQSTLTILARFLGYRDYEDYAVHSLLPQEQESDPVMSRRLSVLEELLVGDHLRLTWHPGRICDVEYLGGIDFQVLASERTRLKPGDTFQCSLIMEGEPLYLDNLRHGDLPPISYVCGKKSGVTFERL